MLTRAMIGNQPIAGKMSIAECRALGLSSKLTQTVNATLYDNNRLSLEITMDTRINESEQFALALYGCVGLLKALEATKEQPPVEKAAMLEAIATALLKYPEPAEA